MPTRELNLPESEPAEAALPPTQPCADSVARQLPQSEVDGGDDPGAIEYASWLQLLRRLGA